MQINISLVHKIYVLKERLETIMRWSRVDIFEECNSCTNRRIEFSHVPIMLRGTRKINYITTWVFFFYLILLQILFFIWLFFILKLLFQILFDKNYKDTRSSSEDEDKLKQD